MYKCICDMCGKNEASEHFKVKKRIKKFDYSGFPRHKYVKIDICQSCYHKLIRLAETAIKERAENDN
mgnify:CR=1 FL=1